MLWNEFCSVYLESTLKWFMQWKKKESKILGVLITVKDKHMNSSWCVWTRMVFGCTCLFRVVKLRGSRPGLNCDPTEQPAVASIHRAGWPWQPYTISGCAIVTTRQPVNSGSACITRRRSFWCIYIWHPGQSKPPGPLLNTWTPVKNYP